MLVNVDSRPHPIDVPAEMEEVRKRLQPLSLPSPKLTPTSSGTLVMPQSPLRGPQDMMIEVWPLAIMKCRENGK